MPEQAVPTKRTLTAEKRRIKARRRGCRVLLVQAEPALRASIEAAGSVRRPMHVVHTPTLAEAQTYLADHAVDLAVIASQLPDGDGYDLAEQLHRGCRTTATVMVSLHADFDEARRALRVGADDLVLADAEPTEFRERIAGALDRKLRDKAAERRIDRLHRLCKKLNAARIEVSKQVDILCNDLVTAYQELACQMQHAVQSTEYASQVKDELDLEALLRRTLEHLMAKLGPANAAIFLPAAHDEYSLGGYVNYDCTKESADLLLEQLGDRLAPRIAAGEDLVYATDPREVQELVGEHAHMLDHAGLVALPCLGDDEALAVLVLFRDLDQPFTDAHLDLASSLAPALGQALEKIIRVHHRCVFDEDTYEENSFDEDDDALPF
jgi:DNA-binding NarL/FixJ family response regulator